MNPRILKLTVAASALLAVFLVYRWWHQPPAVEFDNLRYIQLLWTAVSSRNEDWLNGVDKAVQQRRESGEMSDSELSHFQKVIATARSGDWDAAGRQCFAFAEAQQNRRRSKPATEHHHHEH